MAFNVKMDQKTDKEITIKLFRNVKNTQDLRSKLLQGDLQCSIVKPRLIPDPFVIAVAANKALCAEKLTTKSIYTEILFNLSLSKNITQSLQLFGIDDKETDMYVAALGDFDFGVVDGEQVEIERFTDFVDDKAVQKAYKLKEGDLKDVAAAVCSKIVLKDFA